MKKLPCDDCSFYRKNAKTFNSCSSDGVFDKEYIAPMLSFFGVNNKKDLQNTTLSCHVRNKAMPISEQINDKNGEQCIGFLLAKKELLKRENIFENSDIIIKIDE